MDKVYLAFIRLVKDEEQKIMLVVLKKMETGCDVEKTYHKDMPQQIKAILQDYKDVFPMDLPLRLLPV